MATERPRKGHLENRCIPKLLSARKFHRGFSRTKKKQGNPDEENEDVQKREESDSE